MSQGEKILSDWQKVLELLAILEERIQSDQADKWTDAESIATQLDFAFKAFFEAYTDIPEDIASKIASEGIKVMSVMQALSTLALENRKELAHEIKGFLDQQKGVKAYKKV
ncbi:hypothetical protein SAMN02745127_00286 [Oceanospirillum multiglobuliferum]|uniref:Flagellar protein FliT n=1 Tax=Oceanospirillum multiglobuliferum TaxID=64969 RepID=A0A1T4L430_9GAMM|nr:hypothetical protein [Oceanospirillum multiglobuliferum]OPX56816.1 hypothetical protein BTE48_02770 [Oceanospirillum multiglobuliferum]SJZ49270.1 hypothetical protein SAMN02745127_00286 [Oceanospirillum multiglobuliferum]